MSWSSGRWEILENQAFVHSEQCSAESNVVVVLNGSCAEYRCPRCGNRFESCEDGCCITCTYCCHTFACPCERVYKFSAFPLKRRRPGVLD